MALHRDIYWVGRQWAVTGYGIQACDQRQKGKFDLEARVLWDEGVLNGMRDLAWLNLVDFEQAIGVARRYYPEPPRRAPPQDTVLGLIDTVLKESLKETGPNDPCCAELNRADPGFDLRVNGWPAKFVSTWRVRIMR